VSALSSQRWREISPYLDEVLSLPETDRAHWLNSLRAEHPGIADLLQELLQEQRAAMQEGFLEGGAVAVKESVLAGKVIGPYRLISPIGQGGMGSVWLAQRSDGRFDRRVAVKFLHFSVAGRAERFKREGRILGQLAHAHIAELIDAGLTGSGEPYLVLEYVEGEPIDAYCDHRTLEMRVSGFSLMCLELWLMRTAI
jgi:serine/threonine protein kinase